MAGDPGCDAPCWWGIIPGETSWRDVVELFTSLRVPIFARTDEDSTPEHGEVSLDVHGDAGELYDVLLSTSVADGVVDRLEVLVDGYGGASSELLAKHWHTYSLSRILRDFGMPVHEPRVVFVGPIEPGAPSSYQITLIYRARGLSITFTGPAIYDPPVMRACLRPEDVLRIGLELSPPEPDAGIEPQGGLSLEERIGMDAETFYRAFRDPDSGMCLETPVEIWPVH